MSRARKKRVPANGTADVINLSHDGRGVARIEGKATFIQGALPDEQVTFEYTSVKKDYAEGRVLSVIKASSLRVEPKCPNYALCGGCSLQHLDENEQIKFKERQLLDLLQRYGHTEPETVLPPLTADHWHYRNKARLSVRYVEKKQRTLVGFRERFSPRFITDIQECPILNAQVSNDIPALQTLLDSLDDKQSIAQIEVAAGEEEIALIFRNLTPLNPEDEAKITAFAQAHQYRIFLQPGGPDTIYSFYPSQADYYLTYSLPEFGLTYSFHPADFTQVNAPLNRAMVKQAIALLDLKPTDIVLDLFCGLGNFSLPIAKHCAQVLGVEGSDAMVERAYMNARANNLGNVEFYAANLDDAQAVQALVQRACDKLLIDPPRSGALELVKQIDILNPKRIVYVSCNPVTLARDTEILVNQKGYVLVQAGVMDMFPQTAHVESIALFVKG